MCYSAPVSFGTFFFVATICGYLWIRNRDLDRPISLILLVVVFMQVIEGFLWLVPPGCTDVHKALTAAIPVLLFLQPLLINAIVAWFGAGTGTASGYAIIAVLFLVALPFQLYRIGESYGACVTRDREGHLDWSPVTDSATIGNLPSVLYDIAMLYPLLTLKNPLFGILYVLASIVSRLSIQHQYAVTWPSVWCHFVNGLAVFALL